MAKERVLGVRAVPALVVVLLLAAINGSCGARDLALGYVQLDVKAALQRTLEEEPTTVTTAAAAAGREQQSVSEEGFWLPLVHRSALKKAGAAEGGSYEERLLARLRRDDARVSAINARLQLALSGVARSSLVPQQEEEEEIFDGVGANSAEDFESPVVSGMELGSGEYFSQIGVGVPPKQQLMVLDTGSDVSWIQCEPCSDCYQQQNPIFNPALSSSYSSVSCGDSLCNKLDVSACSTNGTCMYQVSYGDGSYTVGSLATETLTLGGHTVQAVALGCGHDNEGLFTAAAGILGLGGGAMSLPSQLPPQDGQQFSYCLVERTSSSSSSSSSSSASAGTLQFGRGALPRAGEGGALQTAMSRNARMDTFYYADVEGLSVAGRAVAGISADVFRVDASGNGGLIVDSGTAVTRLQTQAYNALRDAFLDAVGSSLPRAQSVSLFDTCFDLSGRDSVAVPKLALRFPGASPSAAAAAAASALDLPPENYLVPVDSSGVFCFAFAPTSSPLSILGNIQQQRIRVSFDRLRNRIGFAPNSC